MIKNITQSFMKDAREYFAGEACGHLLHKKYVEDQLIEIDSESVEAGSYFEFITTGALPKNGNIPQPEYKSGKGPKDGIVGMTAAYRKAHASSDMVKAMWAEMGLEIVSVQRKCERDGYEGTLDLVMRATKEIIFEDGTRLRPGMEIILDLKYSGLLDDKWNKHGWKLNESEVQRKYHGTQGLQYTFVGQIPLFYFWVVQNNQAEEKTAEIKMVRVIATHETTQRHLAEGRQLFDQFELEVKLGGLTPRPSLSRCRKCALKEGCKDKHTFPHPETIEL